MRFQAILWSVALLCAIGCHGDEPTCYQYDLPICGDSWATEDELADVALVEAALLEVKGWIPCWCMYFVHNLEEAQAVGLPQSWKPNRTDGLVRGWAPGPEAYVRAYGDAAPYRLSLIRHEIGHGYGLENGSKGMKNFVREIQRKILEIIENGPEQHGTPSEHPA
jgi:hypothetical protein